MTAKKSAPAKAAKPATPTKPTKAEDKTKAAKPAAKAVEAAKGKAGRKPKVDEKATKLAVVEEDFADVEADLEGEPEVEVAGDSETKVKAKPLLHCQK